MHRVKNTRVLYYTTEMLQLFVVCLDKSRKLHTYSDNFPLPKDLRDYSAEIAFRIAYNNHNRMEEPCFSLSYSSVTWLDHPPYSSESALKHLLQASGWAPGGLLGECVPQNHVVGRLAWVRVRGFSKMQEIWDTFSTQIESDRLNLHMVSFIIPSPQF